ncbi:glyoxylase-like metal-dependent hydrolase (beta-lactamase superfamily II) [Sinobaca qinghaiensis]|uniref:Glyoxylase-like metal-dependent hydrolase (Beta-lactamase superfamily II) n=1 Tax=Sinobaca qinghaiensis TaxID=342944 RepID=A0A419V2U4_9BACL|nr:MBL fold metallo-hydrolase [Sinobaca qinghaiensis]RKD72794.1 glyoxylase-like metal-dependent hydrolase (beta-lactamase superfamily II) [Sinobaca qinghaiensis]
MNQSEKIMKLDDELWISDGMDLSVPGRTGTYILTGGTLAVIETGPSPSIPRLKENLQKIGFSIKDIRYIIVTHIHLDHAGGAGLLIQECPDAELIVHPKGARHLADPSKLIKGAKAVYGDDFDELFNPVLPVPEARILSAADGETLSLAAGRTLTFYHTPGHADHHISIHDSLTNGVFTGDTAGIQYVDALQYDRQIFLPSTSPNQFRPEQMLASLDHLTAMKPAAIYFGHFGKTEDLEEVSSQIRYWLPVFVQTAEESAGKENELEHLRAELYKDILGFYKLPPLPDGDPFKYLLQLDLYVCAMGLLDYVKKKQQNN